MASNLGAQPLPSHDMKGAQDTSRDRNIDLDIHGVVRIRLIEPQEGHARSLAAQLGATVATDAEAPDIVVRYVDEFSTPGLRYVGLNAAAFTDDGFYILSRQTGGVVARIPFEQIGGRCELQYQRGAHSVPLLPDILRFTFLKKRYVPIHASAFVYNGVGVLMMAWARSGKTGAMLSFLNHGAEYVGDEWILLAADGAEMLGMPAPIELSDWQLKHIRGLRARVGVRRRLLFAGIHFLGAIHRWFPLELLDRSMPVLNRQLRVKLSPRAVLGSGTALHRAKPDKVFLIMTHADPAIRVARCTPSEVAQRMRWVNEYEQGSFFGHYRAFRFAFPHLANAFLDGANELQASLLSRALEGKEVYRALYPYPIALESLFQELRRFC